LSHWLDQCQDGWLRSFVADYVGESNEITRLLIGAGRLCRLESDVSEPLEVPPWKRPDLITGAVLAWAEELSEAQALVLDGLVANTVDRAGALLDELSARAGDDGDEAADPDWQQDFVALCCDRDDIEGLLTLLHRAPATVGFSGALIDGFDERGRELVGRVHDLLGPCDDPQLLRVAAGGPSGWWLAPVFRSS
jgi:hypothetical protein